MGIDHADRLYIPVAHRIGRRDPNYTRAIIAKFPIASEFESVLINSKRLAHSRHFITKQLTAKQRERKKFILPEFKELKQDPNNNTKIVDDKLFVKGSLQTRFLPPRIPTATLQNPSLELIAGDSVTDSGSTFTGFIAKVTNMQDVGDVLHMVKSKPEIAAANHLMYAFRVGNKQNYDSDGDYGVGLHLLRHMQDTNVTNMIYMVARSCTVDFKHIGNRRMEHAVNVCESAAGQ
jgi:hypothetical protein